MSPQPQLDNNTNNIINEQQSLSPCPMPNPLPNIDIKNNNQNINKKVHSSKKLFKRIKLLK